MLAIYDGVWNILIPSLLFRVFKYILYTHTHSPIYGISLFAVISNDFSAWCYYFFYSSHCSCFYILATATITVAAVVGRSATLYHILYFPKWHYFIGVANILLFILFQSLHFISFQSYWNCCKKLLCFFCWKK